MNTPQKQNYGEQISLVVINVAVAADLLNSAHHLIYSGVGTADTMLHREIGK